MGEELPRLAGLEGFEVGVDVGENGEAHINVRRRMCDVRRRAMSDVAYRMSHVRVRRRP